MLCARAGASIPWRPLRRRIALLLLVGVCALLLLHAKTNRDQILLRDQQHQDDDQQHQADGQQLQVDEQLQQKHQEDEQLQQKHQEDEQLKQQHQEDEQLKQQHQEDEQLKQQHQEDEQLKQKHQEDEQHELPWYFAKGRGRPDPASLYNADTGERLAPLWPEESPGADRIENQLMFVPHPNRASENTQQPIKLKKILMFHGLSSWGFGKGDRRAFIEDGCPVNTCTLTGDRSQASSADAILYKDSFYQPAGLQRPPRPPHQIWILYHLESPRNTGTVGSKDVFNWTATYRRDSDLVAPYERWTYYDQRVRARPQPRSIAATKTKKVAWFVSNCATSNGRLQYAKELGKYIDVDIYGACGTLKCPRSSWKKCFDLLDKQYKFYLAFENSNCRDYITEKFFVNGLGHNVLPIVMGAHPDEYARSAPDHSYLHVDDFESPKALADYLHQLDQDDDLYDSYFRWKGTGEFINTHFFCRMCAMLHEEDKAGRNYEDINEWWRGPGVCIGEGSWRKQRG